MPRKVEVAVISKIGHRVRVADHAVLQLQTVVLRQDVAHRDPGISRVSLVPVRAFQRKVQAATPGRLRRPAVPQAAVVEIRTAVKVIGAIIGLQGVILPADGDHRPADAVGVAADGRSEMGRVFKVAVQIVIAQHYVRHLSVPAGHQHGNPHCAQGDKSGRNPVTVGQGVLVHFRFVGHLPE